MTFMNLNVLNFIHNFNFSNTIIFSTCGFHHCSLREQDIILRHCILLSPSCLAAQNNPVVIDLRYLYGSTLESNHNIHLLSKHSANIKKYFLLIFACTLLLN